METPTPKLKPFLIYKYESSVQEWKKTRFLEQIFDSQEKVLDKIFSEEEEEEGNEDEGPEKTDMSRDQEEEEKEEEKREVTENAAEGPIKEGKGRL